MMFMSWLKPRPTKISWLPHTLFSLCGSDSRTFGTAHRLKPALLLRLTVQFRAGIRRSQGNLNRFRFDVAGKLDRLLNRLGSLAWQPEDERSVNHDSQILRVA